MHIVWFSWKDINHPEAGGAELVSSHIRENLVQSGHSVTLITARYAGSKASEVIDGVKAIRCGGRLSVYIKAKKEYKKLTQNSKVDLIIDEMNTLPFFTAFYSKPITSVLLTYQLARVVWFYQMKFPISLIGYLIEPIYLKLIASRYRSVITESESTKKDLQLFGFNKNQIDIIRVGMKLKPITKLNPKKTSGKILFLGAMRPMKRPIDAVKAFELAKDKMPNLTLNIAGDNSGKYARQVLNYIGRSRHKDSITVLGRVSDETRLSLLKDSDLILVTSIKEGWGLIVTEANSQGTPAVAYDTDGLRDSIENNKTGLLVDNGNTVEMAGSICDLLTDASKYEKVRFSAWQSSKQYTFQNSFDDFKFIIKGIYEKKD
jgi:glycosyltransferase involved in cell wall biosynthesis